MLSAVVGTPQEGYHSVGLKAIINYSISVPPQYCVCGRRDSVVACCVVVPEVPGSIPGQAMSGSLFPDHTMHIYIQNTRPVWQPWTSCSPQFDTGSAERFAGGPTCH